ncbi:sensor histidine kinase [Candidatus Woesearchaeota archaeon]|nr:sensor histidine kinase [Candidatus Woesearchaeota archaeon]
MPVDFTLDDLTNTLEMWRAEAIGDIARLSRLANQMGHDLMTPTNYVFGFSNLILSDKEEPISKEQQNIIRGLDDVVLNYKNGLSLMNSFITRLPVNTEHAFTVLTPEEGAQLYLTSVDNLDNYFPFLETMFKTGGPITTPILDYSPHIDSGLKQIIYSANKFFAPVRDCYRIDVDTKLLLKDIMARFTSQRINVEDKLQPASFKEDYVGGVVSYLLNNAVDHAFDGVDDREKFLSLNGSVKDVRYTLIVQDNGTGIDTNIFPDPADIFGYRKSRRANEGEHHGKGLYLVKEFVEEHGGSISVENNERGNGAKFTIELPIEKIDC